MKRKLLVGMAVAMVWAAGIELLSQSPVQPDGLVQPVRQRMERVLRLPELPAAAERIAPLTLHLVLTPEGGPPREVVQQKVTRTAARVHIVASDGAEWFFEQNPLDTRRGSGYLVQHAIRTIIVHEDSELRNLLGLTGWAQILSLGYDTETLSNLSATPAARVLNGIEFVRYTSKASDADPTELWWSSNDVLADGFTLTRPEGRWRVTISSVTREVDSKVLESPIARLPEYRVVTLSEWLEQ